MAKKTVKTPKTTTPKIVAAIEAALKEIQAPATKKPVMTMTEKKPRVSLNSQPIINAKTEALKERGIKLSYAGRLWKAGDRTFTSLEFSKFSVETFAKLFPAKAC